MNSCSCQKNENKKLKKKRIRKVKKVLENEKETRQEEKNFQEKIERKSNLKAQR